jgi:hypothetical protein
MLEPMVQKKLKTQQSIAYKILSNNKSSNKIKSKYNKTATLYKSITVLLF